MNSQYERFAAILVKAARELGEVFDSVQIIATVINVDDAQTNTTMSAGSGPFQSRRGAMHETMVRWDEYDREYARRNAFTP